MFVGDIAHDLLDDVLDRDDAVGAAIFIHYQRQMDLFRLHAREQVDHARRRRHEQNFAHDLSRRQRHGEIDGFQIEPRRQRFFALGILFRIDRRMRSHVANQIADVHHADRIVERVVVDHKAGMGGALENAHQIADLNVLLHGDDVGTRHHHIADPALTQAENVLEHPAFLRREAGFARCHGIEHVLEIGAHRAWLPAKQTAECAHEPVFAAFARRRYRNRQIARLERRTAGI